MDKRNYIAYYFLLPLMLMTYNFIGNLSNDVYIPSLPVIAKQFQVSAADAKLTLSIWFLGVAIPQLFFGPIYQKYGSRYFVLTGCAIFTIASLVCGVTKSFSIFLIGRFAQGVGICTLNIATFAILRQQYAIAERVRYQAYINSIGLLSPLMGPLVGTYVAIWLNWRWDFLLLAIVGVAVFIGLSFSLPKADKQTWFTIEWKHYFKTYQLLLTNKKFISHCVAYGLLLGALIAYLSNVPFVLFNEFSLPAEWFGWTQVPVFTFFILGSWYAASKARSTTTNQLIKLGFIIILISNIATLAVLMIPNIYIFFILIVLFMLGYGINGSSLVTEAMSIDDEYISPASVLLGLTMAICALLGSICVNWIPLSMYVSTLIIIAVLSFSSLVIYKKNQS